MLQHKVEIYLSVKRNESRKNNCMGIRLNPKYLKLKRLIND